MSNIMIHAMPKWIDFAVKTFIIVFAIYLCISALIMPIFNVFDRLDKFVGTAQRELERTGFSSNDLTDGSLRLRAYGMINNPEVHYRMARNYQEKGEIDKALLSISLAMALVEPDAKKYQVAYQDLQNELSRR